MLGASRSSGTSAENRVISTQVFTNTGTWTYIIPNGTVYLEVEMWGAGGGGGYGSSSGGRGGTVYNAGGGGGGGAYARHRVRVVDLRPADKLSGSVGTGAEGAEAYGTYGGNGGDTTLATYLRGESVLINFSDVLAHGGKGGLSQGAIANASLNYNVHTGGTAGVGVNLISIAGATGTIRGGDVITGEDGKNGGDVGGIVYLSGSSGEGGTGGTSTQLQGTFSVAPLASSPGGGGGGGGSDCSGTCADQSDWSGSGANGMVRVKAFG